MGSARTTLAARHVDWFNNRRLLEPTGYLPPTEAEASYYAAPDEVPLAA